MSDPVPTGEAPADDVSAVEDDTAAADDPVPDEVPIPGDYDGGHPARNLLSLFGRAHALSVLCYLARADPRPWRFSELEETLSVSPNTLSSRLDELAAAGLVERTSYDEIPPRVEYEATQKALDLDPVFKELRQWAADYDIETGLEDEG